MSKTQPLVGMGFYSLVGFLRPAIYFFLLPLYLAYFTVPEYAIYNLMIDFAAIAMIFASLKLNTAMVTFYYDFLDDRKKQLKYLGDLYSSSLMLGTVIFVIMYFVGEPLFKYVFKDESIKYFPYGLIVIAYTLLFEANQCYLTFLKNEKKLWQFSGIMMLHVLSIVILQFIFIIVFSRGVQGALEGILLGNVIVSFYILIKEKSLFRFRPDFSEIASSLRFTVILIPYLVIYWLLSRGGRFFLESYTNLDQVAAFALLMTLAGIIILAVEAVINGVRPFLFEQLAKGRSSDQEIVSLLSKMVVNIPLLFVPLIILLGSFIHLFSDKPEYKDISIYMPWACLAFFLLVLSKLFYQQLLFAKKSTLITILSSVSALVLIMGFVFLIPDYEIWGVLVSTIAANLVTIVLFFYFAQKIHYINHSFSAVIVAPLVVFISIFLLFYLFAYLNLPMQVFGIIQFVVALILIALFNVKNIKEYIEVFNT